MRKFLMWAALGCLLAFRALALPATPDRGNWWEDTPWGDPDRGFNWYPDPKIDPQPPKPEEEKKKKTIEEMTDLEEIKKEVERLKGVAVANPTKSNVLEFLRAQNFMMNKASLFADVARRVVWEYPEVNYAARSTPVNAARDRDRTRQEQKRNLLLKDLSQTHGILFFARSDCPYCHDQAPVLRRFAQKTGIPILAVSMDARPIPMFPDAKPDNGISMLASGGEGIKIVPAIFLIERETQQVIPLGTGVIALDDLEERIRVMTSTQPGQEF